MSQWRLIKLKFGRSPAHFGELGIGIEETSERVRSDTLFSAWMTAYARLLGGDAIGQLLEQFQKQPDPPFRLSSTLIYQELQGKTIYYLPRPKSFPLNYRIGENLEFAKDYKKLEYLPLEIWREWYQGKGFSDGDLKHPTVNAYKDAYKIDKFPRVAIDRTSRATNFYHTGMVHYNWQPDGENVKSLSGLYFLLYFPQPDSTLEADLKATLAFLGEEGLGGERSSGAGRFVAEWHNTLPNEWNKLKLINSNLQHHTLISVFWTDDTSQFHQLGLSRNSPRPASYELQRRGGWIASPTSGRQSRRKSVQMFTEGSVFAAVPQGKLADVTPDGFDRRPDGHKIYRSGIALSLPVKIQDSRSNLEEIHELEGSDDTAVFS